MKKDGFTLIELIMTMMTTCVALCMIVGFTFHKAKTLKQTVASLHEWSTSYIDNGACYSGRIDLIVDPGYSEFYNKANGKIADNKYLLIDLKNSRHAPYDPQRDDFVTFQLIGGGGGGGSNLAGTPGEVSEIVFPSIPKGTYRIEVGRGGTVSNSGEKTSFKLDKNDDLPIDIIAVKGGVSTNEDCGDSECAASLTAAQPTGYGNETDCGHGGAKQYAGGNGELKISW